MNWYEWLPLKEPSDKILRTLGKLTILFLLSPIDSYSSYVLAMLLHTYDNVCVFYEVGRGFKRGVRIIDDINEYLSTLVK